MFLRSLWQRLIPRKIRAFLFDIRRIIMLMEFQNGHYRSSVENACVDRAGKPLPWYTYPAIEYLKQLDFSDKSVFEYGCGNSTLFWAKRAKQVVSVEHDPVWFNKVKAELERVPNINIYHHDQPLEYIAEITRHGGFDVIIVDGVNRPECAQQSLKQLNPGGMIIFDNADRFLPATKLLRESGLIEIDMIGLLPLGWDWSCTSLFLRADFNIKRVNDGPTFDN